MEYIQKLSDISDYKKLNKILKNCNKQYLIDFILYRLEREPLLLHELKLFIEKPDNKVDIKKKLSRYFKRNEDRFGYLEFDQLDLVNNYCFKLINDLKKRGKVDDLITACAIITIQFNSVLSYFDDPDGEIIDILIDVFDELTKLVKNDAMKPEEKDHFFSEFMEVLDDKDIYNWDCGHDIWELLKDVVHTDQQLKEFIQKMANYIDQSSDWSAEYARERMALIITHVLKRFGRTHELSQYIKDNLEITEMRRMLVNTYIDQGDWDSAKELVEEGIKIAKKQKKSGAVSTWEEYLLTIAVASNDQSAIVEQAIKNFLHHEFDIEKFEQIKQFIPQEKWLETRDMIIHKISQRDNFWSYIDLLPIYEGEAMWEELLRTIQDREIDLDIVEEYAPQLIKHNKQAVIQIYIDRIRKLADEKMGRNHYRLIAGYLNHTKMLGGGTEASSLAKELRHRYPNRRAMLEELAGI